MRWSDVHSAFRRRFVWALLAVIAFGLSAAAQTKPTDDPFSDANRFEGKASSQKATPAVPFDDPFAPRKSDRVEDRIDFIVKVTPSEVRRGETAKLELIGMPRPGYYTYPLTQRTADQPEGQLAVLKYGKVPGVQPLWPVQETQPEKESIPELGQVHLKHKKEFTWTQDILVLPDAEPGKNSLPLTIHLQVCDENCVVGDIQVPVEFTVSDAPPVALTPELQERRKKDSQEITLVGGGDKRSASAAGGSGRDSSDMGLLAFMLQGLFWGAISLFTPCVFPMIPITVSYFLKQSEKEGHRPFTMSSVYSLTIVTVLTVSGVLLIPILQPFSQHWATNLFLGLLFFIFALSLFGMFDIRLPSSLANLTQSQEGRGGLVGVMFMALTFTIISFTCVAPFYGTFIALTASAQSTTDWLKITLGSLSFSVAFASPFFLLALFPTWLKSLPKSGGWMNTVKVVMAFLEVAAAVKFLRAAEIGFSSKAQLLTYDLSLGIYIAISVLCGLYLLNLYRLPHDEEGAQPLGVPRLMVAVLFISLGLYLLPGLFRQNDQERQKPAGSVFAWLDSFLLPDFDPSLPWNGSLEKGLEIAREQGRYVFIDFTGQL
jgi:thiol:disulfide interchange protein